MPRVPWPVLDHLVTLTDDVGVLQHATYDVPNRSCGYCLDDVGRALVVASIAAGQRGTEEVAARLMRTYLAYCQDAQLPDGWFHNFMGYDRRWQDDRTGGDAFARALWGIGYAECNAPRESWREIAAMIRRRAMPHVTALDHLRPRAYAILGLVHSLDAAPSDAAAITATIDAAASFIADAYDAHKGPGWVWCEDVLTYDNARLPEALLRAGHAVGSRRFLDAGYAMLEFLVDQTVENGVFAPVGNQGWYPRGGVKAQHGQQPLEAAAMVDAALVALDLSGDERWRRVAETAHAWFSGRNTHGADLVRNGGCCDGIDETGANPNMGAESTVAYLMSAIALASRSAEPLRIAR